MTTDRAFDAILSSWLEDEAASPIPTGARGPVFAAIETRRPRPAHLAFLGSHWITDAPTRFNVWMSRPALTVWSALIVLLAIALLGTAAFVGGQLLHVPIASPVPDAPPPSTDPVSRGPAATWIPDVIPAVGPLTQGTYSYLNVDGVGINARFTVPEGWTWDGRSLRKDGVDQADRAAILFFGHAVDIQVYADPCHWKAGPSVLPTNTIDGVVAALEHQPSRTPSTPPDPWVPGVNISDSARGLMIDLTVPAGLDLATCDEGEYRSWTIRGLDRSHEGAGQRDRVSVIDIYGMAGGISAPGGIIIDAASFPTTSPTVMAEMDGILDSIVLGHWG